ncbi:MAG: TonB-dependent receptor [Gillisia sp.]
MHYQVSENTFSSLSYQFNDTRTDRFFNNETFESEQVALESFNILDFYLNHRINDNLSLFGGITNLTNEKYEEIYRFNSRGRNAKIGVLLNF